MNSNTDISLMKKQCASLSAWKRLAIVSAAALCLSSAQAAIQLNFVYNSVTDITIATYSGTWDVSSERSAVDGGLSSLFLFFEARSGGEGGESWHGITGPYPWQSYGQGFSREGDYFSFGYTKVWGPTNFTPSTVINGSLTYDTGIDLADLGFDADEIANGGTLTGSAGTVNWTASVSAVPEPSTHLLMLGGIALLASRRRRTAPSRCKRRQGSSTDPME